MLEGLANAELRGSVLRILPVGQEERAWRDALVNVVRGFGASWSGLLSREHTVGGDTRSAWRSDYGEDVDVLAPPAHGCEKCCCLRVVQIVCLVPTHDVSVADRCSDCSFALDARGERRRPQR